MEKLTKVGFREFTRYVQSLKNGNAPCVCCGEMTWKLTTTMEINLQNTQSTLAFSLPYAVVAQSKNDTPGDLMINNAMPLLIKQCNSCGNMTFFNHETVLNKLNSLQDEGDDEHKNDRE